MFYSLSSVENTSVLPPRNLSKNEIKSEKFYQLFLQQMNTQNPLKPMDSNTTMNSLMQLSALNSSNETDTRKSPMLYSPQFVHSLLGKNIRVSSPDIFITSNSPAELQFQCTIPAHTQTAYFNILNENQHVVYTQNILNQASDNQQEKDIIWNKKDINGQIVDSGKYTIEIHAKNDWNQKLTILPTITGNITAIEWSPNKPPLLVLPSGKYSIDQVVYLSEGEQ